MKIFSYLYDKMIGWSGHRHAPYYLAGVSLAESSFFPIPPDVMLVSMGLATPQHSWRYAGIATCFSVLGGILGYLIGLYCMELLRPWVLASSYAPAYHQVVEWFETGGIWIVILASFTPFPYKIFTITAGAMQLAFIPFVVGSLIGRGLRFFLVASVLYFAGATLETKLRRYADMMGWAVLVVVVLAYLVFKWA